MRHQFHNGNNIVKDMTLSEIRDFSVVSLKPLGSRWGLSRGLQVDVAIIGCVICEDLR